LGGQEEEECGRATPTGATAGDEGDGKQVLGGRSGGGVAGVCLAAGGAGARGQLLWRVAVAWVVECEVLEGVQKPAGLLFEGFVVSIFFVEALVLLLAVAALSPL